MRYDDYDYEDDEELKGKLKQEKIMFFVLCGFTILVVAFLLISSLIKSVTGTQYSIWDFPLFNGFQDDYQVASNIAEKMDNNKNEWEFPYFETSGKVVGIEKNTIIISIDDKDVLVSLIGIDIPKSTNLEELLSGRLTEGDTLLIDYEKDNSAYVYFDNGTMVQKWLLASGYVSVNKKDFSKKDEFEQSEKVAKNNKVGIWSE